MQSLQGVILRRIFSEVKNIPLKDTANLLNLGKIHCARLNLIGAHILLKPLHIPRCQPIPKFGHKSSKMFWIYRPFFSSGQRLTQQRALAQEKKVSVQLARLFIHLGRRLAVFLIQTADRDDRLHQQSILHSFFHR